MFNIQVRQLRLVFDLYDRVIVVRIPSGYNGNLCSKIRSDLDGIFCASKKSFILEAIRMYNSENDIESPKSMMLAHVAQFIEHGQYGLILTNWSIEQVDAIINRHTDCYTPKLGSVAKHDIHLTARKTNLVPTQTSFFAALNIATKITKGQIEIVNNVILCKKGEKIGYSQHKMMTQLEMKPCALSLEIVQVIEPGLTYAVQEMMPIVDSRVEEAIYELQAFGVGAGVFTFTPETPPLPPYIESESSDDYYDLFGLF
jgi:large subunit ribosomal protein LP0